MRTGLLSFLATVAAVLTVLGGLELFGVVHLFPENVATGFATILSGFAAVHIIKTAGDVIDDGLFSGSWSPKLYPMECGATIRLPT